MGLGTGIYMEVYWHSGSRPLVLNILTGLLVIISIISNNWKGISPHISSVSSYDPLLEITQQFTLDCWVSD